MNEGYQDWLRDLYADAAARGNIRMAILYANTIGSRTPLAFRPSKSTLEFWGLPAPTGGDRG